MGFFAILLLVIYIARLLTRLRLLKKGVDLSMDQVERKHFAPPKILEDKINEILYQVVPECKLPQQDEDTVNSDFLISEIAKIQNKGTDLIQKSEAKYKGIISKLDSKVRTLSTIGACLGGLVLVILAYLIAILAGSTTLVAIVIALCVTGIWYIFSGLLVGIIYLKIIPKFGENLEAVNQAYEKYLRDTERMLADDAQTAKEQYYNAVLDAQMKYGVNNGGISVLADWCCGQLMGAILKADHRTFLEYVYAKIYIKLAFDRAEVNAAVLIPESTAAGMSYQQKDLTPAAVFVLQENSIYNLSSDLCTLVGCTQALCAHIREKMGEVLKDREYDPEAEFTIESNDNAATVTIKVKNPKFIPFQDM